MAWTAKGNLKGPKGDAGDPAPGTNLGTSSVGPDSIQVTSSTGSPVTLTSATGSGASGTAGLMSGGDKKKLDGIAEGAEANVNADWNAVSGDAQILNKPTVPATSSGTYTPSVQLILNAASAAGGLCTYQRVGNSVDVAGSITVTPSAAGSRVTVRFSIPVPSDFATNSDAGGSAVAAVSNYSDIAPCYMQSNASTDQLVLSFIPATTGVYTVSFATTYPIM